MLSVAKGCQGKGAVKVCSTKVGGGTKGAKDGQRCTNKNSQIHKRDTAAPDQWHDGSRLLIVKYSLVEYSEVQYPPRACNLCILGPKRISGRRRSEQGLILSF